MLAFFIYSLPIPAPDSQTLKGWEDKGARAPHCEQSRSLSALLVRRGADEIKFDTEVLNIPAFNNNNDQKVMKFEEGVVKGWEWKIG